MDSFKCIELIFVLIRKNRSLQEWMLRLKVKNELQTHMV